MRWSETLYFFSIVLEAYQWKMIYIYTVSQLKAQLSPRVVTHQEHNDTSMFPGRKSVCGWTHGIPQHRRPPILTWIMRIDGPFWWITLCQVFQDLFLRIFLTLMPLFHKIEKKSSNVSLILTFDKLQSPGCSVHMELVAFTPDATWMPSYMTRTNWFWINCFRCYNPRPHTLGRFGAKLSQVIRRYSKVPLTMADQTGGGGSCSLDANYKRYRDQDQWKVIMGV